MTFFGEAIDAGPNVSSVIETADTLVLGLSDASGEGTMTVHQIFDGAAIMYNDMHLAQCHSQFQNNGHHRLLAIDHCREGRIEQALDGGAFFYMQEHELRVDNRAKHVGQFSFPLSHYHGITFAFDLEVVTSTLKHFFGGFSVDLYSLEEKYCASDAPFVLHNDPGIEHIFSELYHVPQQIRTDYFRVKALELLLYLDALEISDTREERPYFYKEQVEKIKAIHTLITEDLELHYTLEELAERFQISLTSLKTCFKELYGDSPYSYLRRYRMNAAATMLRREHDRSIAEIAGAVGYESQSKFSTAFKQVMGQSPMAYRKSFF